MVENFEVINVGSSANDGQGDPLRVAFEKINNNFSILNNTGYFTYDAYSYGNTSGQVIFEVPAILFTQATFQINSDNTTTNDSQNITINASLSNDLTTVKWVGHSTLFINDYITRYNMDVDVISGNVRILVDPIANATLYHFINAQVVFSNNIPGLGLITQTTVEQLITENGLVLTTTQPG